MLKGNRKNKLSEKIVVVCFIFINIFKKKKNTYKYKYIL